MIEEWQSPGKYEEGFTEQADNRAEWTSVPSPISRAKCVAVMLAAAETAIGHRGGPALEDRVQSILDNAREHNVSPAAYEVAYFIARTIKAHVSSGNEANRTIAGKTA